MTLQPSYEQVTHPQQSKLPCHRRVSRVQSPCETKLEHLAAEKLRAPFRIPL